MADEARALKSEPVSQGEVAAPGPPMPLFYANTVGVTVGFYDFTLMFGHRLGSANPPQVAVAIAMSPQQAAALSALLAKHVQKYGEKHGEIKLPKDLRERLEASVADGAKEKE